jgi:hypothetical protein
MDQVYFCIAGGYCSGRDEEVKGEFALMSPNEIDTVDTFTLAIMNVETSLRQIDITCTCNNHHLRAVQC